MVRRSGRVHLDMNTKKWFLTESKCTGKPIKQLIKELVDEKSKKKKKSNYMIGDYDLRI